MAPESRYQTGNWVEGEDVETFRLDTPLTSPAVISIHRPVDTSRGKPPCEKEASPVDPVDPYGLACEEKRGLVAELNLDKPTWEKNTTLVDSCEPIYGEERTEPYTGLQREVSGLIIAGDIYNEPFHLRR